MLICYPHGLGDCILLTPAIREYYNKTGKKVSIATLERFKSSMFFNNNPYVDKIFYTKDAWNDFSNYHEGCQTILEDCNQFAKENNIDKVIFAGHKSSNHKILSNYIDIGLKTCINPSTEIFTTDNDVKIAKEFILKNVGNNKFGFIQTKTGVPTKNLPEGFGKKWLKENFNLEYFIEVGESFKYDDFNLNVQFEIMRRSFKVCLADSVFYHACGAINKPVDYVYFQRGERIYNMVKPLHPVLQNISYQI